MDNTRVNTARTALHFPGDMPLGNLTKSEAEILNAVRGCTALADFVSVPKYQTVRVMVATIGHTTPKSAAKTLIEQGFARATADLERQKKLFLSYGPEIFMPRPVAFDASCCAGFQGSQADLLRLIFRRIADKGHVLIRAGHAQIEIDAGGHYVVAKAKR